VLGPETVVNRDRRDKNPAGLGIGVEVHAGLELRRRGRFGMGVPDVDVTDGVRRGAEVVVSLNAIAVGVDNVAVLIDAEGARPRVEP